MSDPNRKLDSQNIDPPPTPQGDDDTQTTSTTTEATVIPADSQDYPDYTILVRLVDEGPIKAEIDGPHTSAAIDLGAAMTHVRVRVTHMGTSEGPNLNFIIERA
jgi:hypothetical protein